MFIDTRTCLITYITYILIGFVGGYSADAEPSLIDLCPYTYQIVEPSTPLFITLYLYLANRQQSVCLLYILCCRFKKNWCTIFSKIKIKPRLCDVLTWRNFIMSHMYTLLCTVCWSTYAIVAALLASIKYVINILDAIVYLLASNICQNKLDIEPVLLQESPSVHMSIDCTRLVMLWFISVLLSILCTLMFR